MPEPSSPKDLRSFGLVVGGAFLLIGVWPALRHGEPARAWALGLAAVLIAAGLVLPWSLRYPYRAWMLLGHALAWVNTRILMTVMFYAAFTPAAMVMRLIKRDAMTRRFDPSARTYRVAKAPRPASHITQAF